jgi:hypothetical protein
VITDDQLASMRSTLGDSLTDTCTRRRYAVGTADAYGNPAQGTAADVAYDCRLVPAPGNEESTDRDVQTHDAAFLLPHDADVIGTDLLIHETVIWQVLGPSVTQSWPTHLRVLVRRTEAL